MEPKLCYIRESYFKKNAGFIKMLDAGNISMHIPEKLRIRSRGTERHSA